MTKKQFIAEVASLSKEVEYVAAGGGSLFDPGEIAVRVLPNLRGGQLVAYLFRRFGYPSWRWDEYKELTHYLITTPMKDVFLEVRPYMGGDSPQPSSFDHTVLMFGYCVDKAIEEESYYPLLMEGKRNDWYEHPRYKECNQAFEAAMRDLLRPVYVRDVPINCYGLVLDDDLGTCPSHVEPYHAAGYPIPQAFLRDTDRYVQFTDALSTLGDGSMDKGIDRVIKNAATLKLYTSATRAEIEAALEQEGTEEHG